MRKVTGQPFTIEGELGTTGIVVLRADNESIPASVRKALEGKGREAYHLQPEGDRLWISANADMGLVHGIYAYLDQLGCRWFFPSERWTIMPRRDDIRLKETSTSQPGFACRMFFGTGGFGGALPCDPKLSLQGRWMEWQRRNHIGGEFLIAGHSGEGFNVKHKTILEEHPEYRAMVNGERVLYSLISKFCSSNPDVVKLYIADRIASHKQTVKLDPEGPRTFAVSVEPADGGGHCECPECRKIGTASDRVFHVANQVAKALAAEYPQAKVSLLAYNEHAKVPSIKLEPNVFVMVTPYAFQRTGLTPDQLIDAWAGKVNQMSIYDYWSIPDWSRDLPTFDFFKAGSTRLRSWPDRKIVGFSCESTFSGGAMGPAWYVLGRLAWNPKADHAANIDEFFKLAFGPSEKPMRRMMERWADGFCLTSHELALAFRDVDEAWKLAEGRPEVQARVADYGRYVEYMRLWMAYLDAKLDARHDRALKLLEYMYNIYDSAMIHAFRLGQLVCRDEFTRSPDLRERYDNRMPKAAGWQVIKPLDDAGVRELVTAGVKDFTPTEFTTRHFTGKLVALKPVPSSEEYSPVLIPSSGIDISLLATAEQKQLKLRLACELPVRVSLINAKGELIEEKTVTTGKTWAEEWSDVTLALPEAGVYQVKLFSPKRTYRLSLPLNMALSIPNLVNSQGRPTPRLYFYVPKDTTRLAFHAPYIPAGPPRFFDPSGVEVKPQLIDGGKLILVDLPEKYRGTIWSFDRAKAPNEPIRFMNVPQWYAFTPEAVLVPEDALK